MSVRRAETTPRPRRIALCMLALAGPMIGSLGLARALRARGHDVSYIGMAGCAALAEPEGFPTHPIFERWFPADYLTRVNPGASFRERKAAVMEGQAHCRWLAEGGHAEFDAAMARIQPDLLLIDGSQRPTWALLARRAGVRAAYLHTTMPPGAEGGSPPIFSTLGPGTTPLARLRIALAWQRFYAQRRVILLTQRLFRFGFDWIAETRRLREIPEVRHPPVHEPARGVRPPPWGSRSATSR